MGKVLRVLQSKIGVTAVGVVALVGAGTGAALALPAAEPASDSTPITSDAPAATTGAPAPTVEPVIKTPDSTPMHDQTQAAVTPAPAPAPAPVQQPGSGSNDRSGPSYDPNTPYEQGGVTYLPMPPAPAPSLPPTQPPLG